MFAVLLLIDRLDCKCSEDDVSVWDTDDMTIEDVNRDVLLSGISNGLCTVDNVAKSAMRYYTDNSGVLFSGNPVMLACGDIWYNGHVWNAFTGSLFELSRHMGIRTIFVGSAYYSFGLGWAGSSYRDATFLFKSTEGKFSNVLGHGGVRMSREEFMRKVVLGAI